RSVAHASRVLAITSRDHGLFLPCLALSAILIVRKDRFGETPKPTRETAALPRPHDRIDLSQIIRSQLPMCSFCICPNLVGLARACDYRRNRFMREQPGKCQLENGMAFRFGEFDQ